MNPTDKASSLAGRISYKKYRIEINKKVRGPAEFKKCIRFLTVQKSPGGVLFVLVGGFPEGVAGFLAESDALRVARVGSVGVGGVGPDHLLLQALVHLLLQARVPQRV